MDYSRKFVMTTDATADLPVEFIKENNIIVLPMLYSIDEKIFSGIKDQTYEEFYNQVREGKMPKTMAANIEDIKKIFVEPIKEGMDIIHLSFSSGLSGTYNNACIAARELMEEYPERRIEIVDSLSASMGEGLLFYHAFNLMKSGASMDEVVAYFENTKHHLCHLFTVDDLHCLQRGGRISRSVAVLGSLINVKPVLHVDNEGHLVSFANVRGRKKALASLVNAMEEQIHDYKNEMIFISHGDCIEDALKVRDMVSERFKINNFMINPITPVIGAHSGPGTVALFFLGESR